MSLLTPHAPHKLRQIMRHGVFYLLLLLNIAASTAWAADYGDAPSTMASIDSNLSTTYGDAWHTISGTIRLGANIDNEAGSQSTGLLANGDGADDDGVAFPLLGGNRVLFAAQSTNLTITTGSNGYLNAWIDWNQDGDWNDAGEQVATNVAMTTGSNTLSVTANDSVPHGVSYARFRFTSYSVASPSPLGAATDGEVEDYRFNLLLAKPLGACLGIGNSGFEQPGGFTSFYKPTENLVPYWSTVPNNPADGNSFITHNNIELWETGFYNIPSYEGRYFAELNADVAGTLYQDTETSPGTLLYWSFAHRGRYTNDTINLKIGSPGSEVLIGNFTTGASAWKVYSGTYTVPAGQHITRFAFQAANGVSYGNFLDSIDFKTECPDWSDAPASYGDVSHQQVLGMKLGTSFTTDAGAYHDADANADPSDDGVTFSSMALGQTATINVAVSNSTGFLQAWADLNNNGTFDTGEQIAANARDGSSLDKDNVVNGIIRLNVPIPLTYPSDYLFTRFRWASASNLGASGSATDGEVEDYKTTIIRTDFGDAPSSYGSAVHSITSNLYLGSNNLDAEAVAATPLNGSGDNVSGSNDEDGIVQLPSLTTLSTSAYITVNVTNTTGQKAWLVGWIDLNGNGVFDPSEAQTLPIPTGASNKQVGLNWSGLTGLSVGTTYLRLRLTTDTSIATGSAST
ncbi:GEVED domain-containing protein, partial [Thiolinea disciformis]|uniref:GEVED domain-containing protein n=1 Tax=Thiolinea disciformis TaxID=125614 RepID=UPI00052611B5